ncbi:hypothetical protein O9992_19095 [Vibrio lentus]|nr:hypothetical protein [Vibrio lentus]
MPSDAIRYYHIAGHLVQVTSRCLIPTVWRLTEVIDLAARYVFDLRGSKPLLLERDNNITSFGCA